MPASIVIATFNHARLLDRTLASIYKQTVPFPVEVIVVDDGSNDDTPYVLSSYPVIPIRVDRAPTYRNPSVARNLGIARAAGNVLIMQSDDVMHHTPNSIHRLVELSEQNPQSAVFATVYNVDMNGHILDRYVHPRTRMRGFFFLGAIRRESLLFIGGNDEEFTKPGYDDTWLADCIRYGLNYNFHFTYDVVGHHQHHDRPGQDPAAMKEMEQLYKRKRTRARAGLHPWAAVVSSLYTK